MNTNKRVFLDRYVLVDKTDDNWWYVAKQLHAVNDGFYLPRTYVKPVRCMCLKSMMISSNV